MSMIFIFDVGTIMDEFQNIGSDMEDPAVC